MSPVKGPLQVATSFGPLTDFARRIGGDEVVVRCPVPEDEDPAFWLPTRDDVLALHDADLILLNGAGFERWTRATSLPLSRVVDTTWGWRHELMENAGATAHRHGPGGTHSHGGTNPHTWLDPAWALRQAEVVRDAFVRARPHRQEAFEERYQTLRKELDELNDAWGRLGPLPEGEVFVASHPSYDYLFARFGWDVINVDIDPEEVLDELDLFELQQVLIALLEQRTARTVLFESPPAPELERALSESLGLSAVVVPPCEDISDESFVTRMRANVERLAPVLGRR
jgi:zinc transport system substrate-binding protein